MENTIKFLKENINIYDTLIVATSGGPDSMCLLSLLCNLKEEYKLNIVCAHVNHKTRKETDEEAKMVKKYCEEKNIIFESKELNCKFESNFEMEARKFRYIFFKELIKKYQAKYLLTAHHGDDLIETILMRIVRGSILRGYRGILLKNQDHGILSLRPLLFINKEKIIKYVDDNNIPYMIDKSNFTLEHTRNKFRHKILPFLKEENSNVHLKFLDFSNELNSYYKFVDKYVGEVYKKIVYNNKINCLQFNMEDDFIQFKILEKYLDKIFDGFLEVINKKNVLEIKKIINNNISNITIDLPNNYFALVEYNYCMIQKKEEKLINEEIQFSHFYENEKYIIEEISSSEEKNNFILRLNSKEIKLPLKIRYRKNGDRMLLKNSKCHKKINDIFTDEKISNVFRDSIPVLLDSNDVILWVPGIKKSNFDKEKNEIYDIILRYIQKEEK